MAIALLILSDSLVVKAAVNHLKIKSDISAASKEQSGRSK
jgi:hypothetical protein